MVHKLTHHLVWGDTFNSLGRILYNVLVDAYLLLLIPCLVSISPSAWLLASNFIQLQTVKFAGKILSSGTAYCWFLGKDTSPLNLYISLSVSLNIRLTVEIPCASLAWCRTIVINKCLVFWVCWVFCVLLKMPSLCHQLHCSKTTLSRHTYSPLHHLDMGYLWVRNPPICSKK